MGRAGETAPQRLLKSSLDSPFSGLVLRFRLQQPWPGSSAIAFFWGDTSDVRGWEYVGLHGDIDSPEEP